MWTPELVGCTLLLSKEAQSWLLKHSRSPFFTRRQIYPCMHLKISFTVQASVNCMSSARRIRTIFGSSWSSRTAKSSYAIAVHVLTTTNILWPVENPFEVAMMLLWVLCQTCPLPVTTKLQQHLWTQTPILSTEINYPCNLGCCKTVASKNRLASLSPQLLTVECI